MDTAEIKKKYQTVLLKLQQETAFSAATNEKTDEQDEPDGVNLYVEKWYFLGNLNMISEGENDLRPTCEQILRHCHNSCKQLWLLETC